MDAIKLSEELIEYIKASPSMFHTVSATSAYLDEAGFEFIAEGEKWDVVKGGKYYTTRNNSSLIAFKVGSKLDDYHFQLTAAHSDSPTYKVKSNPESKGNNNYIKLNIEAYGGMIDSTWLDKPLSVAGRVMVKDGSKIESKLVNIDEDILLIPNVAPHLNHDVNKGYQYNRQCDMQPMFTAGALQENAFNKYIADAIGVDVDDILASDLFLVNRQRPCVWGAASEFVSSPKLDDLQCAFTSMKAFIEGNNEHAINVYTLFDNEEVGSNTKQGAMSTFLPDTLTRVNESLGFNTQDFRSAVAKSFLVSCDNAHAIHPNKPDFYDADNCCQMNKGIVIKEAANQAYTTDAFSRAAFKAICDKADVPYQTFANRSDRAGGSTLGNLSNIQLSMHAVDFGLAQLAMHSSYETAGVEDTKYAIEALTEFFNTNISIDGANRIELN